MKIGLMIAKNIGCSIKDISNNIAKVHHYREHCPNMTACTTKVKMKKLMDQKINNFFQDFKSKLVKDTSIKNFEDKVLDNLVKDYHTSGCFTLIMILDNDE